MYSLICISRDILYKTLDISEKLYFETMTNSVKFRRFCATFIISLTLEVNRTDFILERDFSLKMNKRLNMTL